MSGFKKFILIVTSLFLFFWGGILILSAISYLASADENFSWIAFFILLFPFGVGPIVLGRVVYKTAINSVTSSSSGKAAERKKNHGLLPFGGRPELESGRRENEDANQDWFQDTDISAYVTDYSTGSFEKGTATLEWNGPEKRISHNGYDIQKPLLYISKGAPVEEEASCIDLKLPVGKPTHEPRGALGYWPTYHGMSPLQRANYLTWLAGGRKDELEDIGYAFVFFYGLERRLLIEKQDRDVITAEVIRLLEQYSQSGSFNKYLNDFLVYSTCAQGLKNLSEAGFARIFRKPEQNMWNDNYVSAALAWFHEQHLALPPEWALLLAQRDPRSTNSIIPRRVPKEFAALFTQKYHGKFDSGLRLKARKTEARIQYRFASPSLQHGYIQTQPDTPDVRIPALNYSSQFTALVRIWDACVEELRAYSKKISKGIDASSREAFETLPEELKSDQRHPDQEKWDALIANNVREDGTLIIEVAEIADIVELPVRPKLTLAQSKSLAESAESIGFQIEPDARLTGRVYERNDLVALFTAAGDNTPSANLYPVCSLILELGMIVAAADGKIDELEVEHISNFIEDQFMLDTGDIHRLQALREVFRVRPPELKGSTTRLKNILKERQKENVGRLLIAVVLADGVVHEKELKALKRIYKGMGLAETKIDAFLEELMVDAPPVVKMRVSSKGEEKIPPRQPKSMSPAPVQLDRGRISNILRDTASVAQLLENAISQEKDPEKESTLELNSTSQIASEKASFPGLDGRYHGALEELLKKEHWSSEEFSMLIREHKLMQGAAISRINEWSEQYVDEFIIDEAGGHITVNGKLLEKKHES